MMSLGFNNPATVDKSIETVTRNREDNGCTGCEPLNIASCQFE